MSLVRRNSGVGECIERAIKSWPTLLTAEQLFGSSGLAAAGDDELLRSLLEAAPVGHIHLEQFLTAARFALLERAAAASASDAAAEPAIGFYCALARQCFINEYVFACGDDELRRAETLRDRLAAALASGDAIPVLWLLAVAAYFPLYSLPGAERLLERASSDSRSGPWSEAVTGVLVQQVSEPRQEQQLQRAIPRLTEIEDTVSLLVQRQYEENPYPRWVRTVSERKPMAADQYFRKRFRGAPFRALRKSSDMEILVAGCGTGRHPIETAQKFTGARLLAVDLSLASLAYAQRKTCEVGSTNVDYAQADILRLGSIGRTFDIIDACGVLHHMADPMAGWGVLLSLLRPGGLMRLGLYSELARADVVAARRFIAERGYSPCAQDIRRCRQELLALRDGTPCKNVLRFSDFSSTSGCRDLLFHVQEHRFTLPAIKAFLRENNLEFLGFDLAPGMAEAFRKSFPEGSFTDLDLWHIFETENPAIFTGMYQFWIQKIGVGMVDL